MVQAFEFLSDEWVEQARLLQVEFADRVDPPDEKVRINVVVTDVPFSAEDLTGHLDTTAGSAVPQTGHLDDPDATITLPYAVARNALIDLRFDELIRSFMTGEIEVTGDVTVIMMLQDLDPTADQQALADELTARLRAITL